MGIEDPFVFPMTLVLHHGDGREETFDPEMLPLPVPMPDEADWTLTLSDVVPAEWTPISVEYNDEQTVPTASQSDADPTIRLGTVHLRPA